MTMPSLIASHKEKETVARFKKVYSTLENPYMRARNENTEITNWFEGVDARVNAQVFFEKLKPI